MRDKAEWALPILHHLLSHPVTVWLGDKIGQGTIHIRCLKYRPSDSLFPRQVFWSNSWRREFHLKDEKRQQELPHWFFVSSEVD